MYVTVGSALPRWGNGQPGTNSPKENRAFLTSVPRKPDHVGVCAVPTDPLPAAIRLTMPTELGHQPVPAHPRRQDPEQGPGAPPLSPCSVTEFPDFWDTEGHGQSWGGDEAGGHSFTEHVPLSPAGLSPLPTRGGGGCRALTPWCEGNSPPRAPRSAGRKV